MPIRHPRSHLASSIVLVLFLAGVLSACVAGPTATATVLIEPTARPAATAGAVTPESRPQASGGDFIFHNGVILTMDDALPQASAIHIQGDRIASVGADSDVLAESGPATVVVDLQRLTLMPGFVDTHSHMFAEPDPAEVQASLLRIGVTTTAEMYVDEPLLLRLLDLEANGDLRVRLSAYLLYNTSCGDRLDEWWRGYPSTRVPGEMLRIGGIKVFTDGGSCNAPAVTFEYANGVGTGDLYFTQAELEAALRSIDGAGYQAAVHAIGDRALDVVLGGFENLWHGANPRRHRIEHNAVIRPDQLARYSAAQPVATIFAPFATCHKLGGSTRFKYEVPDENRTWEWPWRDLVSANPGLHLAWHGDMPHVFPPDALYQLFAMVTRAEVAEDGSICQPPDWIAHNALTVDEALGLMTVDAAYALDRDAEVGSLSPGKLADVVILSDNPRTVPPQTLKDLQVLMTMVGGKVEYCADGMQALCPAEAAAESTVAPTSPGFVDDFEAADLAGAWSWVREDAAAWSLSARPGWLRMETGDYRLLREGGDAPLLLQSAPAGDFEIRTRLEFIPSANFHFAGLVVYLDDDRFVALGRAFCGFIPPCVGDGVYLDNDETLLAGDTSTIGVGGLPGGPIWLRLVRQGLTFTGYWSADGGSWTSVGSTNAAFAPQSVGLMATTSGTGAPSATVDFDAFHITE